MGRGGGGGGKGAAVCEIIGKLITPQERELSPLICNLFLALTFSQRFKFTCRAEFG